MYGHAHTLLSSIPLAQYGKKGNEMERRAKYSYVATRTIPMKIKVSGKSAMDVDRFMHELRMELTRVAKQAQRQYRNHVSVDEVDPWGMS